MIITLIFKKITDFRIEIKRSNLSRFLNTNNLQIFFAYISEQNIEYTYQPQSRTYHLHGRYFDDIVHDICQFRVDQVLSSRNFSEQ